MLNLVSYTYIRMLNVKFSKLYLYLKHIYICIRNYGIKVYQEIFYDHRHVIRYI